jgi:hypothetical protein
VRSSRASRIAALLSVSIAFVAASTVSAHRRDEYLQAARIGIEPDRINLELSLTAGIAIAQDVVGAIDQDHDGAFSAEEQQAYARRVLTGLTLRLDEGPPARLDVAASTFADPAAVLLGEGTIAIQADVVLSPLSPGQHHLYFHNRNDGPHLAFLANALVPESHHVQIAAQRRNQDQRDLTIDFTVGEPRIEPRTRWRWIGLAGGLVLVTLLIGRARLKRA